MPVCDEIDTVSHVTHLTTANSRDVRGSREGGVRWESLQRKQCGAGWTATGEGSSQHGYDKVGRIQLAGCKTRLWAFRIQRIPLNVKLFTQFPPVVLLAPSSLGSEIRGKTQPLVLQPNWYRGRQCGSVSLDHFLYAMSTFYWQTRNVQTKQICLASFLLKICG